jgi:hypothetical protein
VRGPRRIAISPDDMIWYTDFARGFLGRLDVTTGKVTEWQSPSGPNSEPYGIVFTKGALWYNESFAKPNTIVRFDRRPRNSKRGQSRVAATSCATWMSRPTAIPSWPTASSIKSGLLRSSNRQLAEAGQEYCEHHAINAGLGEAML